MDRTDNRRQRIAELLQLYSDLQATPAQEQELFELINPDEDEEIIRDHIEKILFEHTYTGDIDDVDWERLFRKIIEPKWETKPAKKAAKQFSLWWYAAAAIALLLGMGYYLWTLQSVGQEQRSVALATAVAPVSITPPASTNAVLTLANGQNIGLDSASNGVIVQQGTTDVVKIADGEIVYRGDRGSAGFNTLTNPRGSRVVNVKLSDGTKVWLNVASSIRYPVAFAGKERRVEITGEAYFEVAHDVSKPFVVQKGSTDIKVLGTHFNVGAYDDESTLKVTLLEGSVSVASSGNPAKTKVIRPGEQARVGQNGAIALAETVDLNEVMAWKQNMFSFHGESIEYIMRQVSRWYNVDVVFQKPVKERFFAEVSKSTNVATLLEMLEATNSVHFKMDRNTIVVSP